MAITILLDHLEFQSNSAYDHHEFDPYDVYHPCMDWCDDQGIKCEFYAELQEIEMVEYEWDPIWSTDPRISVTFEDENDAVKFKLVWSEDN